MRTRSKTVKSMLTLVLSLCMLFAMVLPAGATDTLTAAEDPRESVMTLSLGLQDDEGNYVPVTYGTCFLVNDEYVLTNNHCVTPDSEFIEIATQAFGREIRANDSHIRCYVHITRDIMVEGTVHENVRSDVMDFALVKLNEKIYDRKPLALGDSDTVKIKDRVYAMGFPADSVTTRDYFTKADVSVTEGSIAKVTESGSENLFEHTATLNYGNSGGPLVTENDSVIGINVGMTNSKYYAIQINFIKETMDTFGVPYINEGATPIVEEPTEGEEPEVEPVVDKSALSSVLAEAKAIDVEGYTDESVAALNDAIGKAETVVNNSEATQATTDSATDSVNQAIANLEENAGINFVLIGGIAAGVLVLIIIVVIIIVVTSGKKKNVAPVQQQIPSQMQQQTAPQMGQTATSVPMQETAPEGAGETTLLDAGAGETTLLSGGGSSAYLIRKKNGEKIMLNKPNFKIGKERRRVDYCVSDNTSVSRVHCEIVRKGADFYAVDQGSTNFTFVNGVQLSPRQETLLSDSSALKISDEEFEFHLS